MLSGVEHEKICITLWPDIDSCTVIGDICSMLLKFANSLDPDQDQQNVGPYLDLN